VRVRVGLDTRATREQVRAALTDVGERRLEVWSMTLDSAKYEVREQGEGQAVVKEGGAGMQLWVVLRYEWPTPDRITWTLPESDRCDEGPG
jgi:hypothetical protein